MNFCPLCFKMLLIETNEQKNRLICKMCRYYFPLAHQQTTIVNFENQEKLEVIEQGQETKELPTTKVRCQKCGCEKAYFEQRQTRSADEASTLFFTCTSCAWKWNEN